MSNGRQTMVLAVAGVLLAAGAPAAVAADAGSAAAANHCSTQSLRLTGPHRAKVGDGVTLRVTERHNGRPARGARIRGFGISGSVPVDVHGRLTVQFSTATTYRVIADRRMSCSNVLVVRVHR